MKVIHNNNFLKVIYIIIPKAYINDSIIINQYSIQSFFYKTQFPSSLSLPFNKLFPIKILSNIIDNNVTID